MAVDYPELTSAAMIHAKRSADTKINLDPETEAILRAKFESGLYASRSDVVREALRLMIRHDALKGWRAVIARHQEEQVARGDAIPASPELLAAIDFDVDERAHRGDAPSANVLP